jgi:hypothetical protein
MAEGQNEGGASPMSTESRNTAEIKAEIEETRRKLGDTVTALAAKTDVKGRVKAQSAKAKDWAEARRSRLSSGDGASGSKASDALEQVKTVLQKHQVPIAAAAAAFVGGLLLGRRIWRW